MSPEMDRATMLREAQEAAERDMALRAELQRKVQREGWLVGIVGPGRLPTAGSGWNPGEPGCKTPSSAARPDAQRRGAAMSPGDQLMRPDHYLAG